MIIHCKYDELVSVGDLKPSPRNANKHPEDQIERLAKILNYQGWRYPIKVSRRSGFVTSGHGRILAAKHLGWERVPVNYQDYEDDDQEHADVHSDNSIAAWAELDLALINTQIGDFDPGFDIDLLGIKDFVLDPSEKEFGSGEDEVPEAPPEPVVKRGELWILGEHRLLIDDCTVKENVERLMAGEKADMVFTDPPYGINESAAKRATRETNSLAKSNSHLTEFVDDSTSYAIDAFNICQAIGIPTQVWFGANYYCHSIPQTNNWLVWDKRIEEKHTDNNSDAELAWVQDGRSSVRIFRHLWKGLIKGSEHRERRVHPTQKPTALAEWCISKYEAKIVLDLFLGSGSTLIACEKTGRRCFGMEIDPHYGQVIIERFQKFSGKKAVREDGVTFDSLKIE